MKKIFYGKAVYDNKEINAVLGVLRNNSLSLIDGPNVKNLEKKVANLFGKKFGLMVNSGSSANLLALSSFNFKPGSEVITPNLTFSTTVAPIYQLGLVPHFIGVQANKFLANVDDIEQSINKKTVAIMIPNLLGNVCDWKKIHKIAKKYKLKIIEDSADTIGYKFKNKNLGKYSDISTNSFYASHIINGAGSGGIVCFNDYNNYKRAKLLRGWGRSSATFNESENINKRFNIKIGGIDYDAKYVFSDLGYNFLPSEVSAAFALEQLKKLDKNISIRRRNFKILKDFFSKYSDFVKVPDETRFLKTAWLAFPIVLKKNKKFDRRKFQIFFEKSNIQTRTIFTGNILRQPVMKGRYYKKTKNIDKVADDVMKHGVLLGCHQGMKINELNFICNTFKRLIA
tara:strand:+ start:4946 stop:6139 length:1194 start_codon:yes stop_codon:yes gene_type:complete